VDIEPFEGGHGDIVTVGIRKDALDRTPRTSHRRIGDVGCEANYGTVVSQRTRQIDPKRSVSRRNIIWLAVVVASAIVGFVAFGTKWGFILAGVALVVSEVVERVVRIRRRAQRAASDHSADTAGR
jgi:hypothetical protein